MSNAILKNAIQTRRRFLFLWATNRFFSFFLFSAVEFFSWSWLLLLLLFYKEELFFFFPKSFCPSFLSFFGASFTHKKSPFIRYILIVYETRADNIYLYATHAFL